MERGVYRSAKRMRGRVVYFSVDANGDVLEVRTVDRGASSEARALVELWDALDVRDPVPPVLTLMNPTPGRSFDPVFLLRHRPSRPVLAP